MPIAALVLGIIGTALSLTPYLFWVGIPIAAVALAMAVVARRRGATAATAGIARAGLILGAVGLATGALAATTCAIVKSPDHFKRMVRGTPPLETLPEPQTDFDSSVSVEDGEDDGVDDDVDPPAPPAALGETITFDGDSIWTVLSARSLGKRLVDDEGDAMTTEGRFVEVRLRVKSLASEPRSFEGVGDLPAITDHDRSDVIEPMEDTARFLARGKKSAVGALLRPNQPQTLTLLYEVPAELRDLRLEIGAFESGDMRLVELGL
jgi:hypothetical protein